MCAAGRLVTGKGNIPSMNAKELTAEEKKVEQILQRQIKTQTNINILRGDLYEEGYSTQFDRLLNHLTVFKDGTRIGVYALRRVTS